MCRLSFRPLSVLAEAIHSTGASLDLTSHSSLPCASTGNQASHQAWDFEKPGISGSVGRIILRPSSLKADSYVFCRRFVGQCSGNGCPVAYSVVTAGSNQEYKTNLFEHSPSVSKPQSSRVARYVNHHLWRVFWAMHYHKSQWRW